MMSGKWSRAWRSRHKGHSRNSDEDPDTDEVDASPGAEWVEVLSLKVSVWTISVVTGLSTPSPACRGLDLRLGSRRHRRPNSE